MRQDKRISIPGVSSDYKMKVFWDNAEKEVSRSPHCSECGSFIPEEYYRSAIAHIFPKSIFKSISGNENNYIILGAGCGCHQKTHRLDAFSEMKIWPVVVEKFKSFEHLITEKNKYLTLFKEYAINTGLY